MNNHRHISNAYQSELEDLRSAVLKMGGKVESQMRQAIMAYSEQDKKVAEQVLEIEHEVNLDHLNIDTKVSEIIALRQPAAVDLRGLIGVIKTVSDLERIGDEATKIAKMTMKIDPTKRSNIPRVHSIYQSAEIAVTMVRRALDAFAREDSKEAHEVMKIDVQLDEQYMASMRQLITFMMEDPRTISTSLDDLWVAKAIERMGDHAENIAEVAIYIADGIDIRYQQK